MPNERSSVAVATARLRIGHKLCMENKNCTSICVSEKHRVSRRLSAHCETKPLLPRYRTSLEKGQSRLQIPNMRTNRSANIASARCCPHVLRNKSAASALKDLNE